MIFSAWRKSTRSGSQGNCVEVATSDDGGRVGVRDSKQPNAGVLIFSNACWRTFLASARKDVFSVR